MAQAPKTSENSALKADARGVAPEDAKAARGAVPEEAEAARGVVPEEADVISALRRRRGP